MLRTRNLLLALVLVATGCVDATDDSAPEPFVGEDLPVGDVINPKADGHFGAATRCKEIPYVEPLNDPKIIISLDGLTLRLVDEAGTYDEVFPIGVGAMEDGESLTPTSENASGGTFYTRTDEPAIDDGPTTDQARWGWNHRCRMWWTDDDGSKKPVFAGLPFIRFAGHSSAAYGIHGPIDDYTLPSGGNLRRGYVSHGCVRMSADGIKEVWGRLQGKQAEVVLQKPVERLDDGTAVDYDPWLLSECSADSDCDFDGGFCQTNEYSGRGYCTRECDRYCPDRAGHPTSFCVANPEGPGGICTVKAENVRTAACERYEGFNAVDDVARPDWSATSDVCLPGSDGWIGDRCLSDSECEVGHCTPVEGGPGGVCTQPCSRYCPDKDGAAGTFCINAPATVPDEDGMCVARCSSDDDCAAGTRCESQERFGQSWVDTTACVPM